MSSYVFDGICKDLVIAVQKGEARTTQVQPLLTALIGTLKNRGWDRPETSLHKFKDHDYVVQAFADNDITLPDKPNNDHTEIY